MKLTVGARTKSGGFALPTILVISTVMLIVLVASVAGTAASRVSLDSQLYNKMADQAVESGKARANECLRSNGYEAQWSTKAANRDLRPHTNCMGTPVFSNPYVVGVAGATPSKIRTHYSIEAPSGSAAGATLKVVGVTELVRTSSPDSVWRRYEQVSYLTIEPPVAVACPSGYVAVPGNSLFGTSNFCAGKYEAKLVSGTVLTEASGLPYVSRTQAEAASDAATACNGCHLITEREWLTIAHNVLNVASNWSGGAVGSGYVFGGHNDNVPANTLAASADDNDGYSGTGNASGFQRRTLMLSNGQIIWDLAGNVYEWTSGQINGGQPGPVGFAFRDWNTFSGPGSLNPNPMPSFGTTAASSWTAAANGIGRAYTDSGDATLRGILRSGGYSNGNNAGIFTLAAHLAPTSDGTVIGFRIAR